VIAAGGVSSGVVAPSILLGMIVAGCIPTTIASNVVMTRNAGGDEAAAIIEVVIGNVVGSFLAPWLIYALIPGGVEFDPLRPASAATLGPMYASVMKQLGLSVLLPLALGQILRRIWPQQVLWVLQTFYLAPFCSALLALLVW
jgi:solute carrier family 10 (sodium/bile acid cotransporter), member 7